MHEIEDVRRQQLAVYRSPPLAPWAWPVLGVAVFLYLSSFELHSAWVAIAAPLVYALFVGMWAGLIVRRSGVQPRMRGMPKPLLREMWRFWIGCALVMGAAIAVGFAVSFVLAGALAGVATVAGGRHYERRYARRAEDLAAAAER